MTLETYRKKRNFQKTAEPKGKPSAPKTRGHRFVVQEHHASQLHFDFRLEMGGVLKSWAVPKGPSLDPREKRLAIEVEDHPVDYIDFEGNIAEGNYGAGRVVVWDSGEYELLEDADPMELYEDGKLSFKLHGDKLGGQFNLIKMPNRKKQWLLIKSNDEAAKVGWKLETILVEGAASKKTRTKKTPSRASSRSKATTKKIARAAPIAQVKETLVFKTPHQQITIQDIERAPMPDRIEPMLATLVDKPFIDPEWLFENKWDGVRALSYIDNGQVRLVSRNQKEMTFRYPELQHLAQSINAQQAIIDGEIVVLDERGNPNFQLLQSRIGLETEQDIKRLAQRLPIVYYVFDLLYYNGFNIMPAPLIQRKALLESIIKQNDVLRFSTHVLEDGKTLFEKARAENREGIVAKHQQSAYVQRRSGRWLKLKTAQQQEVVIGGYTQPRGTRELFGALVVGLYRDNELVSVGHIGGGFNRQSLKQVYDLMQPLKTNRAPFKATPPTNQAVQWVKPQLVAEVKFAGWTGDEQLRQPIFLGLRDDKDSKECVFEAEHNAKAEVEKTEKKVATSTSKSTGKKETGPRIPVAQLVDAELEGHIQVEVDNTIVSLTHLDKVYWQDDGYTKGDLIKYYVQVSDAMLPYLHGRPLILKRYPNGINAPFFFQHDLNKAPDFVHTESIESEDKRAIDYAIIDNLAALLYLTNLGSIEEHPWHSRIEDIDHPDWMVFDLDPEKTDFGTVCEVALALQEFLARLKLKAYAKTSGSRGIHVFVPIQARYNYSQIAKLAEQIAILVARENPKCATVERSRTRRASGHVYIDHMQNAKGKSIAAAYSARARSGATVSAPLAWAEVKKKVTPQDFTIKTVPERFKTSGDLFEPVLEQKENLDLVFMQIEQMFKSKTQ